MFIIYFLIFWVLLLIGYIILSICLKVQGKKEKRRCKNWHLNFESKYSLRSNDPIQTTIAGIKHENREKTLIKAIKRGKIALGKELLIVPEPKNAYDKTATKICTQDGEILGYLPNNEWNDEIFYDLCSGKRWEVTIAEILTPREKPFDFYNLLLNLWKYSECSDQKIQPLLTIK